MTSTPSSPTTMTGREPGTEAGRRLAHGSANITLSDILAIEDEAVNDYDRLRAIEEAARDALDQIEDMTSDRDYDSVTAVAAAGILRSALAVKLREEGT